MLFRILSFLNSSSEDTCEEDRSFSGDGLKFSAFRLTSITLDCPASEARGCILAFLALLLYTIMGSFSIIDIFPHLRSTTIPKKYMFLFHIINYVEQYGVDRPSPYGTLHPETLRIGKHKLHNQTPCSAAARQPESIHK